MSHYDFFNMAAWTLLTLNLVVPVICLLQILYSIENNYGGDGEAYAAENTSTYGFYILEKRPVLASTPNEVRSEENDGIICGVENVWWFFDLNQLVIDYVAPTYITIWYCQVLFVVCILPIIMLAKKTAFGLAIFAGFSKALNAATTACYKVTAELVNRVSQHPTCARACYLRDLALDELDWFLLERLYLWENVLLTLMWGPSCPDIGPKKPPVGLKYRRTGGKKSN